VLTAMLAWMVWKEPSPRQRRKALNKAATAMLNHSPDEERCLMDFATIAGISRPEALKEVSEYRDEALVW